MLNLFLIIFFIFCAVGFFLYHRRIKIFLQELERVAQEFLKGHWSARYSVSSSKTLFRIAELLHEMGRQMEEKESKLILTIESLKEVNQELETRQNEQLQIEKLASIGRLAAGVAHEVGNPLGAVAGYIDILRRILKKNSSIASEDVELCDRIETEINRMSRIIRALLQQARPTQERIQEVKIKKIIERSLELAQIPSSMEVVREFEDEAALVMAEEDQLIQVFLNLLINARHAIEMRENKTEKGHLKIRCVQRRLPFYNPSTKLSPDFDTSTIRTLKPDLYWVMSVEDNGVGMSVENQKKLFEPFFSTKDPGRGTGLGLYVAKSVVESFRGTIGVRSVLGYGSAFSVFLPSKKEKILK